VSPIIQEYKRFQARKKIKTIIDLLKCPTEAGLSLDRGAFIPLKRVPFFALVWEWRNPVK
jgi:hypothetical protein